MKSQQRYARGRELGLLAVSVTVAFLLMELAVRYLPLGDQLGWSMVPPVSDRIAKAGAAKPGTARILALGDSMTEWRDNTGESYVRIAEQMLPKTEAVNLAQGGTGLSDYLGNFLRFGARLRPDIVLIGLYLGNDLVPSMPPLDTAEAQASLRASPSPPQELDLKRIAKKSVLLNYLFRVGKVHIPSLRSGFFEQMISQLEAQTGKDDAYVASRLNEAGPKLVDAARADAINGWDLAFAIFDPDYYGELAAAAPSTPKGKEVDGGLKDLNAIVTAVRENRVKVVVVLLPPPVWVSERYWPYFKRLGYGDLGPSNGPVPLVERVKAYLSTEEVPALDVLPALRAETEPTYLENDVHLNRRGHQVIGRELASFLVRQGVLTAPHLNLGTANKF
jgi:GDSL-like Lipase/Acylhydrolase family